MKLLFFIRSLANGGAERQLSLIAAGLQERGYQVVVLTCYLEENMSSNVNYSRLINCGVVVKSINKRGRYDFFGFLVRFITAVRFEKPDIIYSFLELSNIIACVAKLFNRNVKLVWGKRSSDLELQKYRLSIKLEHTMEKILSAIPDLIITNSLHGKEYLTKRKYQSSISVIHNGFEITEKNYAKDEKFIASLCPAISNQVIFGAVGRIDYAKDYETLLQAFVSVIEQYNNVVLLIVGRIVQQDYYHVLNKFIELNGLVSKVIFVPEMSEINKFYENIDIFVSSSYSEGFSNVIAEAMLAGLPCVATNAGDSKVLIGDVGIIVERRDAAELSRGLLRMLESVELRKYYGALARKRIEDSFGLCNLIQQTDDLLKKLYEN